MEPKRPFSELEWLTTPKPVREYIIGLEQALGQQAETITKHETRLEKLEDRVNRNSKNSSKPPSSDPPFDKPRKDGEQTRKKKKRKKGGQKGHQGHRQALLAPDRVEHLMPGACPCGAHSWSESQTEPFYTHQVIELPEIKMDVAHFVLHRASCPKCGRTVKAAIPQQVQSGYGARLSALIAELSGIQGSSRETVQNFCRSVLGFHISTGAIQNVIDRASNAIEPIYEEIGRKVRQAPVNHVDETSFFKGGQLQWLWTMVNTVMAFYMIHSNRSKAAFEALVQNWAGILISDDYRAYLKWIGKRQTCLAHLIRRAVALTEKKDEELKAFGAALQDDLKLLCHWAKAPPDIDTELAYYTRSFHFLVEHCERKDEAGTLARRMLKELDALWLFLRENGVEPTNNRAERALRFGVMWRKRSNGTQSDKGDRWVERILTLKETCRLQSVSSFQILVQAIDSFFKEQNPDLSWICDN